MTALSDVLPTGSPTVQAIYDRYKQVGDSQESRGYLGASIIGHPCERFLWYTFRFCCKPSFDGRMHRLFETGDVEEYRLIQNLRDIGYEVHERDPNTGKQFAISDFGGHFSGHLDCVVLGLKEAPKTWHVGELKSFSAKRFKAFKEKGVAVSDPKYYAQVQIYMHYTELDRGFVLGANKDTDELWVERLYYDKQFANDLVSKAGRIITASEPAPRISDRPDYYECKYCDAHDICWGCDKALPILKKSCRQCCYATAILNPGGWDCSKKKLIDMDDCPCEHHLCLPGLFPYAEPEDYTDGMICFKNRNDGKEWQHGGFCHSTDDLMRLNRSDL